MAALATQEITRAGLAPAYGAAAGGGDDFLPGDKTFIHVKNGGGSAITVTVDTPGKVDGLDVAQVSVSVPAAGERMIGPLGAQRFAQPSTGRGLITYTGVTTVTLAVLSVA
jgi:hypothetical protein